MANAAYYDFFRKIQLEPDSIIIEADSTTDTVTITRGTGVAFNANASNDSFEIDVDYTLYVPLGTTDIRLTDVNANDQSITLTAGNNIGITRVSDTEVTITATVGGASKAISNATQASPVVITTSAAHAFTEGRPVTITDVGGMTELNGNEYYMDILTSTTFALYSDDALTTPVNGTGFGAYTTGGVATAEYFPRTQLSELSDVDTTGVTINQILAYDGVAEFVPTSTFIGSVTGNVTGNLTGDVTGNLTGNVTGNTVGYHTGDVTGSVFADDSTILVDGVNGFVPTSVLNGTIINNISTANLRTSESAIALGNIAGISQGSNAIAIGEEAGNSGQSARAIAIGFQAASSGQGLRGIAIGQSAAVINQGDNGIAIGETAASANQGTNAIAIGQNAAQISQGDEAIAIGLRASGDNQGTRAIAIGRYAAAINQSANSIVINATGTEITAASSGLYINPIRNEDNGTFLTYNTATKEITYTDSINVTGSIFADDSTLLVDGVNGIIPAENLTGTATINVTGNLTGNVLGNLTGNAAGNHTGTFTGDLIIDGYSSEVIQSSLAGTTIALSLSLGSVGYVASPSGDITLNITNVPTTDDRVTSVSVILNQGATPYEITTVQIGGIGQTILWPDGIPPTGTVNGIDIFTFTLFRIGAAWSVTGNMAGYA